MTVERGTTICRSYATDLDKVSNPKALQLSCIPLSSWCCSLDVVLSNLFWFFQMLANNVEQNLRLRLCMCCTVILHCMAKMAQTEANF